MQALFISALLPPCRHLRTPLEWELQSADGLRATPPPRSHPRPRPAAANTRSVLQNRSPGCGWMRSVKETPLAVSFLYLHLPHTNTNANPRSSHKLTRAQTWPTHTPYSLSLFLSLSLSSIHKLPSCPPPTEVLLEFFSSLCLTVSPTLIFTPASHSYTGVLSHSSARPGDEQTVALSRTNANLSIDQSINQSCQVSPYNEVLYFLPFLLPNIECRIMSKQQCPSQLPCRFDACDVTTEASAVTAAS